MSEIFKFMRIEKDWMSFSSMKSQILAHQVKQLTKLEIFSRCIEIYSMDEPFDFPQ